MNAAIAQHLNILESAIVRVEEWSKVLFVVVKGIGARFVSKKVAAVTEKKFFESAEFVQSLKSGNILVPELSGSEKQVKWANDIRDRWLKEFDQLIAAFTVKAQDLAQKGKGVDRLVESIGQDAVKFICAVSSTASAKNIINQRDLAIYKEGNAVTLNGLYAPFGYLQMAGSEIDTFSECYEAE